MLNGYNTIDKVMLMTANDLANIEGFAEKSSADFIDSLSEKKDLINELLSLGIEILSSEKKESPITMKKICITGTLSRKRSEIEAFIRDKGGIVSSSVSKDTDFLMTNDENGTSSKFKKAIKLEVKIISEDDFFQLFN